ncbi:unnamed protein product [Rotaria sp. Silwood2]|nr:unnamed protein product [Rotaria sp. Silwood2]
MNTTSNETLTTVTQQSFIIHPNKILLMILYRYGLGFVFLIGFSGNFASLVTFMSPILRVMSTGCLLFMLAMADIFYLMISIFEFVEVGIVQEGIFLSVYDSICRFRWFMKGFIRFCSAWILAFIAIDRWLRTRFPYKTNQWCTRRNAFIAVSIAAVFAILLHSHMLSSQLFGGLFPGTPSIACGPIDTRSPYVFFFFVQWQIIQVNYKSNRKFRNIIFKFSGGFHHGDTWIPNDHY